jgi:flagellar basal-body rod protein FlgG
MIQSLYTAATAMASQQVNIDTIANNISNINTIAYKGSRTDFADALYAQMDMSIQSQPNQMRGYGMLIGAIQRDNSTGAMQFTGGALDFMISGDGYFTTEDGKGGRLYTRNGTFTLSNENGTDYLTTAGGLHVLDQNGQRIAIPGGTSGLAVDEAGSLTQNGTALAKLGITSFVNPSGLQSVGADMFASTPATGTATQGNGKVLQGYQEGSNVDLSEQMTRLIRAQKAYSILARAISTADQMESVANGIGR